MSYSHTSLAIDSKYSELVEVTSNGKKYVCKVRRSY